jgi:integrase
MNSSSQGLIRARGKAKKKPSPKPKDPIRSVIVKGVEYWMVTLPKHGGGRDRRYFRTEGQAKTYLQEKRVELLNHGTASLAITDSQRVALLRAEDLLGPYGMSVVGAAEFYVKHHELIKNSRPVDDATSVFLDALKADGLSTRYQADCRNRLARFRKSFGQRIVADISSNEVGDWLRSLKDESDRPLAALTRNTFWLRLSALFNFARERGWCSENPLLESHKAKVRSSEIGILTPAEFARLLENASDETLPYWAIGGFTGLRAAELERLDWAEVHFDSDLIEVKAAKSKTASRRFVPIRPALKEWLAPYEDRKGKVAAKMLRKRLERDRKLANIKHWPSNGLRHSFASYHAAEFRDAGMLAQELGHRDQKLIFAHYRELVRPTEAHKYWDLRPETTRSITAIVG